MCGTGMRALQTIIDASVALAWLLPASDADKRYAADVLEAIGNASLAPVVPELWHYETASVLLAAKRRGDIGAAKLRSATADLAALQPTTLNLQADAAEVVSCGLRFHLQGYDAVYFELARRMGMPIATIDRGMRQACKTHRVALWMPR
jgi:predicted nucleic acid-binding protein